MTRRLAPLLAATLLVAMLPGSVAAAAPVAVDDPGTPCGDTSNFGARTRSPRTGRAARAAGLRGVGADRLGCDPRPTTATRTGSADVRGRCPAQPRRVHGRPGFGVAYDPDDDFSTAPGDWVSDSIVYHAEAGGEDSNQATVRLWVAPINDAPSFTPGPMVIVDQDSGPYSAAWATNVSAGPPNESDQTRELRGHRRRRRWHRRVRRRPGHRRRRDADLHAGAGQGRHWPT